MFKTRLLLFLLRYWGRARFPVRQRWARSIAWLMPFFLRSRARIVHTNLTLAFPELSDRQRKALFKRHFQLLAQSVVDRGLLWFGSENNILEATPIMGLDYLEALLKQNKRIILLAPHFIGLDAAATRLTLFLKESATMYTPQRSPEIDTLVRQGRARFNRVHLISRKEGIRSLLRLLNQGIPVYYLPDMDFGRTGAAFVPFFGVQAATLLATAQLARHSQAVLVPIISRLDEQTGQYHIQVLKPIHDFPGELSNEAATAKLNQCIESWVRQDPAQYYWVHRRFKTRPNLGEPKYY